jgi:hypothetical protein
MDGGDIGGATTVIRNRDGEAEARRQRNKGLWLLVCFSVAFISQWF